MLRSPRSLVAALAAVLCGTCATEPPPLPLDVPLAPGQARAGKVHRDSELIGGPIAYARAGDVWKLYNSRVRFLIQDVGTSVGLSLYGGNLIDADLVRPGDDGKNGNDLFREAFPIVGLHVQSPTSIEVISDGTDGTPAHLRVRGGDAPSMILPQLDALGQDLGGEVSTDYILAPDVPYLQIVTTYQALPGQSLDTLLLGDFLSFGASLSLISPDNGFTGESPVVSQIGSVGEGTSYGYVYPEGAIQVPIVDASGTVAMLKSPPLPAGGALSVSRYLVVGDGDAASVMAPMYALRNIATAALSGVVRGADGSPLPGARVTLFRAPYDAKSNAVDQAHARADGTYAFRAPPGDYVLIAGAVGHPRSAPLPVTLGAAGASQDLQVSGGGVVRFDIGHLREGARGLTPAKVSFQSTDVERPDPRFGPDPTESERNGLHAVALLPDGQGQTLLKPGSYDVTVSRGPEFELERQKITVQPGTEVTVRADLRRVVDTTGWLAGDYHQHAQGSIDSPVSSRQRVIEDLAEGVELPASTDHDNISDFRPHIAALSAEAFINAVSGDEISVNGVGHFNAYPLHVDPADPYAKIGAKLWARATPSEWSRRLREAEPGPIIVHVSHPRTKSLAGYFNTVRFDPTTGQSQEPLGIFDAIEVNGELGQPADFLPEADAALHKKSQSSSSSTIPTLRDWFALLNLGQAACALGNSDTHGRNDGTGYPRSYVFFGTDDARAVDGAALVAALRGQQVVVSNGPFVTVTVDGLLALGKARAVRPAGPQVALGVKVQAPSWIGASTIEVYENGRPLLLRRTGPAALVQAQPGEAGAAMTARIEPGDGAGAVRFAGAVAVTPRRDSWYVVVVRGEGTLAPIGPGSPYAYTNPVYVDLGGDGWTAPGL